MAYFDENMKNLFDQDDQLDLPDLFSWEQMQEGIYAKMDAKKPRKKRFIFFFVFTSFLGISFLAGYLYLNPLQQTESITPSNSNSRSKITEHAMTNSNSKVINLYDEQSNLSRHDDRTNSSVDPKPITNESEIKKIEFQGSTQMAKQFIESEHSYRSYEKNRLKKPSGKQPNPSTNHHSDLPVIAKSTTDSNKIINRNPNSEKRNINPLLALEQLKLSPLGTRPSNLNINIEKTINLETNSNPLIAFEVTGGILFWQGKFTGKSNYLKEKNRASSKLPGFQLDIRSVTQLSSGVGYSYGLTYQHLREQFNISVDTMTSKLYENALIRSERSTLTGNVIHTIRQDTLVTSNSIRTVRHWNQYTTLGLNAGVWKKWKINDQLSFRTSIGTFVGYRFKNSGKHLAGRNSIEILDEQPHFAKNLEFALYTGLRLDYSIGSQVSLHIGGQVQKYLTNWSVAKTEKFKPTVYYCSIGITKKM